MKRNDKIFNKVNILNNNFYLNLYNNLLETGNGIEIETGSAGEAGPEIEQLEEDLEVAADRGKNENVPEVEIETGIVEGTTSPVPEESRDHGLQMLGTVTETVDPAGNEMIDGIGSTEEMTVMKEIVIGTETAEMTEIVNVTEIEILEKLKNGLRIKKWKRSKKNCPMTSLPVRRRLIRKKNKSDWNKKCKSVEKGLNAGELNEK